MKSNDQTGTTTGPQYTSTRLLVPAGLICLALLALRIAGAFSFRRPFLEVTSGCEEEALFSLWKVMVKEPLFTDWSYPPYAVSYYNWAFYWFYGLPWRWLRTGVAWDSAWLPSIARWMTLGFAFGSAWLAGRIVSQRGWWPTNWRNAAKLAFCVLAVANPVTGFFAFTARPDVGSLFFELLGFLWLGAALADRRQGLLYAGILALYFAWSFKQIAVCVLVFSGRQGAVNLWARNKPIEELQAAFAQLPSPALCTVGCGNLPWVQTKPPLFVYASAYFAGRSQGKQYADSGLEDLIARGYFKTIALEDTPKEPKFYGQPLTHYEEIGRISGYTGGKGLILYQYRGTN